MSRPSGMPFYKSLKGHPPDGDVIADASPEECLWELVKVLLCRITGANNKEFLFVFRELAIQTSLLDEATQKNLRPLCEKMEGIIRELLGPYVSKIQVRFCTTGS